ncbi:MAG: hypothetical protein ABII90_02470 [Bacteroidota bacterium]
MKKIQIIVLLLLFFFVLNNSCRKKLEPPNWDVDVLAPIFKSTLGLNNIIADSLIQTNPDSSIIIVYENMLYNISLDTLVQIPDTNITEIFSLPFGSFPLAPGDPIPTLDNDTNETKYNLQAIELSKVIIRSGQVNFFLTSTIEEITILNFKMPGATKGGIPFEITEEIPAGTPIATIDKNYDLSGYEIDLKGLYGINFNTFSSIFTANISPYGDTVIISAGDYFKIEYGFIDIITEYAKGYFGQYDIEIEPTSEDINIFNSIAGGSFDMESISIFLKINNGFGIDIQAIINNLTSFNTQTNTSVALDHSIIGSAINLTRATETPSPTLPFTYSEYDLNITSPPSNADVFIENIPDQLRYSFDFAINPYGNQSLGNDFLYYDSDLKIYINMELPVSVIASNLTLSDTVDFNLDENNIIDGFFYLYADNGFPIEAIVQLYLLDDTDNITDSLISPGANTIEAASIDGNQKVTDKKLSKIIIPVSESKLDRITDTKKALIIAQFTTKPDNQYIKIYSDYVIDLKLVGDFNYRIEVE